MRPSLIRQFGRDARFYHQLMHPGQAVTPGSLFWTVLRSRGLWLLTMHRIAHFRCRYRDLRNPTWWLARILSSFDRYINAVCFRSEIREDSDLSETVYLSNKGYLICGAHSIGAGTLIHDHTTMGYAVTSGNRERPKIGSNVWIGPHCIIAGSVTIGDGATILPGSFLTHSVPARAVVEGNPARVVRRDFDNTALRDSLAIIHKFATDNS